MNNSVIDLIAPGSRVLDLGCGSGELLHRLIKEKRVQGTGIDQELSMVTECIRKGIPCYQGNLDEGLTSFSDQSYDFVILSHTLQVIRNPELVLKEILRVGKKALVSVPNFGYWKTRFQLVFRGRMPVHKDLPYQWYNTPNIHLCTAKDFECFAQDQGARILKAVPFQHRKPLVSLFRNLRATEVWYLVTRKD